MKKLLLSKERGLIVEFGQRLIVRGLTSGTGGNLSIVQRRKGLVAISPSGLDYFDTRPEDVVVVDLTGRVVEGRHPPSSEVAIHTGLYALRADVGAVVHTHSTYATTFACLQREIPASHYLVGFCGPKVPVAAYATYGTSRLADHVTAAMELYNAVLMANHGLVAVGVHIADALATAEAVEFAARVHYQCLNIGDPVILPDQEMATVIRKFKDYGAPTQKPGTTSPKKSGARGT